MKRLYFYLQFLTIVSVLCMTTISCSKDDDNDEDDYEKTENLSNQDPEGTIVLNMASGAKDNYYQIGDLGEIHIDAANNFCGYNRDIIIEFVTIGNVDGLGKINKIPQTGWSESAAVVPGTGYFMRSRDNYGRGIPRYARIFVVNYLTSITTDEYGYTTGNNSGATIKYQAPLQQTISLSSNSLTFPNKGGSECVVLKSSTHLEVKEKPDWCYVKLYMDSVLVRVGENESDTKSGKIVLTNLMGDATINITQGAVEPIVFENTSLTFTSELSCQSIKLKKPTTVKVTKKPDWCEVWTTTDSVYVEVNENVSASQRSDKIEFNNAVSSAYIKVTQMASSSPLFEKGTGSKEDPYQIRNAQQLENISKSPSSHFILINDIDLTSHLYEYGNGWEPIVGFKGNLDGKGYTIKGLWVKRPSTDYIGLFSSMSNATISNLIISIDEKGITGNSYVGALCGTNKTCSISKCSVLGYIQGNNNYTGGLCGESSENTIISQCTFSGTITGSRIGGICGTSVNTSIFECKSEGLISGYNYSSGIVGVANNCYISNCYCQAQLFANKYSCGISYGGDHTCCYFAGSVTSNYGFYCEGTYTYFDNEIIGSNIYYYGSTENNGHPTYEMMMQATYEGWDFINTWKITEGVTYPTLRCFDK